MECIQTEKQKEKIILKYEDNLKDLQDNIN